MKSGKATLKYLLKSSGNNKIITKGSRYVFKETQLHYNDN